MSKFSEIFEILWTFYNTRCEQASKYQDIFALSTENSSCMQKLLHFWQYNFYFLAQFYHRSAANLKYTLFWHKGKKLFSYQIFKFSTKSSDKAFKSLLSFLQNSKYLGDFARFWWKSTKLSWSKFSFLKKWMKYQVEINAKFLWNHE